MDKQVLVLLLGGNVGDTINYFNKASELLKLAFGQPLKSSAVYQTMAWGVTDQNDFLNQIVIFETSLSAEKTIKIIKDIEIKTGRVLRQQWHQREIDIDIIFYGYQIVKQNDIIIPHPRMQNRNFVLIPLNEVFSDFVHPEFQLSISDLLKSCPDTLGVKKWESR